jgi:2,4-dienoyl-CoA reductase-like NADH-dependent reductase (Old Yellow Enzyme family)
VSEVIASAGVHFVDYSAGFYTVDRRLIYPGIEKGVLPFLGDVLEVSRELTCICGVGGNVQELRLIPELPKNFVVSVGRALIADPQVLKKTRLGNGDQIKACKRTGRCHYFSRRKRSIECGVNELVKAQLAYE